MNNSLVKVKHVIGAYKDSQEFPAPEDLVFMIHNWFYMEGGKTHIESNTSIDDTSTPVFTEKILMDLANNKHKTKFSKCLNSLLSQNQISIIKKTQHGTYYRFETEHYK